MIVPLTVFCLSEPLRPLSPSEAADIMTSLRDYLRDHAKFYCLPVERPGHQSEFTAVNDIEVEVVLSRLDSHYAVIEARRVAQLVDALNNVLNEELGENPIPKYIEGEFEWLYSSDMQGICDVRRKPNVTSILCCEAPFPNLMISRPN